MTQFLKLEQAGGVCKVILNRPDLHNAFNDAMISELDETFQSLGKKADVRVIILAAESKSFCAGADLNWMQSMLNYTLDENVADATRLAKMLQTIDECPKPVIGRIHGAAFGGGVGLTSVCDLVVAVESAIFSLSEVKLGLLPAVISPFVINKIGRGHARRYFMTAERFSAKEAHHIGLVSEVVSSEADLDTTINTWIETILQNGPEAVGLCKTLIQKVSEAGSTDQATEITTRMIAERRISAEGQDGMRAFLEKRKPSWQ